MEANQRTSSDWGDMFAKEWPTVQAFEALE